MLIVRVKRCEAALAGGRLDEAFELLRRPDFLAHRRGQELVDRLLPALVARGTAHLAAGRLGPASADCQKAASLAGNTPDVAHLCAAIENAASIERQATDQRHHAVAAARRMVDQGQLTLAGDFANRAQQAAEPLLADIRERRATFDHLLANAAAAVETQQWELAADLLTKAEHLRPGSSAVQISRHAAGDKLAAIVAEALNADRLVEASALIHRVPSIVSRHAALTEAQRGLELCQAGCGHARAGRTSDALQALMRLKAIWPRAAWIGNTVDALSRAGAAAADVQAGPLGMLTAIDMTPIPAGPSPDLRRFLLHVDGAGSFLVVRADSVRVGPLAAWGVAVPDVTLMAAPNTPGVTFCRSDDEYLLTAASPVTVNERPTSSALLSDGDRIGMGSRCRIEFRRPNPASASAMLHVTGARLPWGAVRGILLMGRELIIGPSTSAHARTRDSASMIVLHAGDGRLLCRSGEPLLVDGCRAHGLAEVKAGSRIVAGTTSFAIQAA